MKWWLWGAMFLIVIVWLFRNRSASKRAHTDKAFQSSSPSQGSSEVMTQCLECGVYLPVSEAISVAPDVAYCCQEHYRRHHKA